jgi:hypothetical protein
MKLPRFPGLSPDIRPVLLAAACTVCTAAEQSGNSISDRLVRVEVDPGRGTYGVTSLADGRVWVADASFALESWSSADARYRKEIRVGGADGRQVLTVRCVANGMPSLRLDLSLDPQEPGVLGLRAGLTNATGAAVRVRGFQPMTRGRLNGGKPLPDARILTSESGINVPRVITGSAGGSANNLLLAWGAPETRLTMVLGALTTAEFTKRVNLTNSADPGAPQATEVFLEASDPVGRLVDPGETWWPEDSFVMLMDPTDPFSAAERYAAILARAVGTPPNLYPFPTVCAWYAGVWKTKGAQDHPAQSTYQLNTTAGLAKEAELAAATGITRYAPVGLRLVPDNYTPANPQGWWDDEHWRLHGLYTEPCETSEKFGKALHRHGALAFTYVQPICKWSRAVLSEEFRTKHADWLRGGTNGMLDYSKPEVRDHVRQRFAALRGHIDGLMVDYCDDLWTIEASQGGFADPKMTSTAFYRAFFRALRDGIGPQARLHERALETPNNDLCLGIMDSQRTAGDTDQISPDLVAIGARRWYKNRVVNNYDLDSKDLTASWKVKGWSGSDQDGRRMMLTMCYVTSGRLLLANSFRDLDAATLRDLSRVMPFPVERKTARPVDLFVTPGCPRVYDFEVEPGWHQVTLYNTAMPTREERIVVPMSGDRMSTGSPGLDPQAVYHVYDFWNDRYLGQVPGDGMLEQTLRPGEARMLAMHAVRKDPQVIATDRHLMQGYVDFAKRPEWNPATNSLSGVSHVIGGDPLRVIIAPNGRNPTPQVSGGTLSRAADGRLLVLTLESDANAEVPWSVGFE